MPKCFFRLACLVICSLFLTGGPVLAAQPSQAAELNQLETQFNTLLKDEKRNSRRDVWLDMEKKFGALEKKSKGETAARAAFYNARSRQELGRRSFLASDNREAVARFAGVADRYGKYSVAPAALYRQGFILHKRLDNHSAAVVSLERLIKSYPKAKGVEDAKKLLASARAAAGAAKEKPAKDRAGSVTLKNIRWKGQGQKTIITLELDAASGFEYSYTPGSAAKKTPGRLHLNIEDAVAASSIKPGLNPKNMVVSRIRTSQSGEGVRITFDCDGARCYAVTSPPDKPQIIQIEFSRKQDIAGGIATAKGRTGGKGRTGSAPGPDDIMRQLGLTVETIMLDAGHGGKDPGAIANSFEEKRFTLAMAKRIGALLKKEGFNVLYTRSDNRFITLQDRPDMANSKKADLFISIHANANPNASVRGLETYYLDEAKSQDAATVASRENAVSVQNISDLQFILTDLMLSSKVAESRHLANCIHGSILQSLKKGRMIPVDNGVRSAPFYVLMGARMPAILVEFGYITNTEDAALLRSEKYLHRQAEGVVQGIKQYKQELARIARSR